MIKRPVHNSLARWRRGITAAALAAAAAAGSAGGSAARAGGGRGSRLFSFFVHYLFRLRPRPCWPSGRSQPAALAAFSRGQARRTRRARHPRAPGSLAVPPEGGDPGRALAAWSWGLEETFPPAPSPPPRQPARPWTPGAAPPALRAAGRSREPPGASAPRPGPQLRGPGGPSGAETFAPVPRALPRLAKPPGARAVARVRTEAPPRGRGIGEAAGFKWGAVWRLRNSLPRGERDLRSGRARAVGRLGRPPRQGGVRPRGWSRRSRPGGSWRSGAGGGARESAPG